MQVSVEVLPGLERRIKISVPAERVEKEFENRVKKLVKEVRMDGFRPGKVPVHVVKQRFGASVRGEVIGDVIRDTYFDAIQQEKLHPAGDPNMELTSAETGKALEYTALIEIYPEIQLQDPSSINIKVLKSEVTEDDINQMLEKLRKQQAEWIETDKQAEKGDRVVIDFEGFLNDEPFEGGNAKDVKLELGSGTMIPGFEEGLIGAKSGSEIELNVRFPDQYPAENLAGQMAKFKVKVHKVLTPKLPEVDDNFAAKMGMKEGGITKLREEVRSNMERELKRVLRNRLKDELFEQFLKANPLELPKVMVENEIKRLQQQTKQQYAEQLGKEDLPDPPREQFISLAEQRVGLGLLFAEFVKQHNIQVDANRVRTMLEELAAVYQQPEMVISWYYNNKDRLAQIESLVMEEQVVDILLEKVKVDELSVNYDEVMNPKRTEGER